MAITFTGWHGGKEESRRVELWERERNRDRKTNGDLYRWMVGHIEHGMVFPNQAQHANTCRDGAHTERPSKCHHNKQ